MKVMQYASKKWGNEIVDVKLYYKCLEHSTASQKSNLGDCHCAAFSHGPGANKTNVRKCVLPKNVSFPLNCQPPPPSIPATKLRARNWHI